MTETELVALISAVGAITVAALNRGGWKRVEHKLDALAGHLGVKIEDSGKVVPIERAGAYADHGR